VTVSKEQAGWKTVVDIDTITWGQLRRLVHLADYMADDDPVEVEWEETLDVPFVTGLVLRGDVG
jgi:hypothetical protein